MNRAQRRRQARQPVIIAGDGIVAAELTGSRFEAVAHAQLPEKSAGEHRWIATAAYVVTVQQAKDAHDPDVMKFLDHENLLHIAIGCWDCEQPLGVIDADSRCQVLPTPHEGP